MNNKLLLDSLEKYYKENKKSADILISIIKSNIDISLRSIDWFITNSKNTIYIITFKIKIFPHLIKLII